MDISKLAVILSASAAGFVAGMHEGEEAIAKFQHATVVAGATAAATAGIAVLAEGFEKVAEMANHSAEAIDANAKLSDATGVSVEALGRLQYSAGLAGVSTEALTMGLNKMLKTLGGSAELGEDAKNAFDRLGLSAKELAVLPTEQAFALIAEKLAAIHNPAERAAAAVKIFGKGAAELIPLLTAGSDELVHQAEVADKLGLTYSRVDAAKVEAANDALYTAGKAIEGIFNQLVIQVAPFITALTDKFVGLATEGQGFGATTVDVFESVLKAAGTFADWFELATGLWYGFKGTVLAVVAAVIDSLDTLGEGLVELLNLLPGVELEWTGTFKAMADSVAEDSSAAFNQAGEALDRFSQGANSAGVAKTFDEIRRGAQEAAEATAKLRAEGNKGPLLDLDQAEKAAKVLKDLQKQVDEFGLTESEKKVAELKASGASPEEIRQAEQLVTQLETLQAVKKAQDAATDAARKFYDETRTPLEKYQKGLSQISELLASNLIDEETAARKRARLAEEYDKATGLPGAKDDTSKQASVDIVQTGSQEAARLIAQVTNGSGNSQRDLLNVNRQSKTVLEKIAENTRNFVAPQLIAIGA